MTNSHPSIKVLNKYLNGSTNRVCGVCVEGGGGGVPFYCDVNSNSGLSALLKQKQN